MALQESIGSTAPVVFIELNQSAGLAYNTIDCIAINLQVQNLNIDEFFRNILVNTL